VVGDHVVSALEPGAQPAVTAQKSLSGMLGLILVGYGILRLLLLAWVLSYASWPRVLFDWNAFKVMLAYALVGIVPIMVGLAITRRRWWTRSVAPWAVVAVLILDLHIYYIGAEAWLAFAQFGFGVRNGALQVIASAIVAALVLVAFVVMPDRLADRPPPIVRPGRFMRTAAMLLMFGGVAQLLFPAGTLNWQAGINTWITAYTRWIFAPFGGGLFGQRWQVALDVIASAGVGLAALVVGIALMRNYRWARTAGIVLCAVGGVLMLTAIPHTFFRNGQGVLALAYAVIFLSALILLVFFPGKAVGEAELARAQSPVPHKQVDSVVPDGERWHAALIASLSAPGVEQAKPHPWRARFAAIASVIAGGVVMLIGRYGYSHATSGTSGIARAVVFLMWLAALAFFIEPMVHMLGRRAQRMRARNALQELLASGDKRPILYLRSFDIDQHAANSALLEVAAMAAPVATPEQELAKLLAPIGPMIAIGRPGERFPELGAARFYVTDEQWQQKIADAAAAARYVVLTSGITEGLRWEVGHLMRALPPEKLILWAHPQLLSLPRAQREREWGIFRNSLGTLFRKPLPEKLGRTHFFRFDPSGEPIRIEPQVEGWWRKFKAWLGGYQKVSIAALVQSLAAPPAAARSTVA
jgi:hypothetical protein